MIVFSFKEEPETRENYPCLAFRWTFQVGFWHVGFVHQAKSKESGKWNDSHTRAYEIHLVKRFALGMEHFYYDGPHCSFCLGWLHFCWGGNLFTGQCNKCEGDRGGTSA